MSRRKRKQPSLEVRLAATLLAASFEEDGSPWISFEDSKKLTAKQIIRRFTFDHHPIPHAQGGPDLPWNLTPLLRPDHAVKTAKVDVPQIAKTKRIAAAHQEFVRRVLAPVKRRRRRPTRKPFKPTPVKIIERSHAP